MSIMVPIPEHNEEACVADFVRSVGGQTRPSDHLIVAEDTAGSFRRTRARIPVFCRGSFPSMQVGTDLRRQRVDETETFGDRCDLSTWLQVNKSKEASARGAGPSEVATDRIVYRRLGGACHIDRLEKSRVEKSRIEKQNTRSN